MMQLIASPNRLKSARRVVVFCPGDSLTRQASAWAVRHPKFDLEFCYSTSMFEVRRATRDAAAVLIDATEDPAGAMAAFFQAIVELEAHAVAVYTETVHEESLELVVRARGALMLLGPVGDATWDGLFERMLQPKARSRCSRPADQRKTGSEARRATARWREQHSVKRYFAG